MILFVTPSERIPECAATLHEATGEDVVVVKRIHLQAESYFAVVVDQYLLEAGAARNRSRARSHRNRYRGAGQSGNHRYGALLEVWRTAGNWRRCSRI